MTRRLKLNRELWRIDRDGMNKTRKNKPEPRITCGVTERRDAKVEPYALLDAMNSGMTHRHEF